MKKEDLIKLKKKILELSDSEKKERDIYLRDIATDKVLGPLTGYPEIDKPWLQYYDKFPEDIEIPNESLYDFVLNNNSNSLDDYVLNYFHHNITYRELFENVDKYVSKFTKIGIKKGDVVSICSLTTPEMLYSFFALNKIGAIGNMLDPRIGNEGIKSHINKNNSKYFITLDVFGSKVNEFLNETTIENVVMFSLFESLPLVKKSLFNFKLKKSIVSIKFNGKIYDSKFMLKEEKDDIVPVNNNASVDDVACIVYTGGTTADPKAVELTNKSFVSMAAQYSALKVNMERKDKFLSIIPPFFPYGICVSTYVPIALGLETIIVPKFDISMFSKLMMEYKPNHITGVPKYWEAFMKFIGNKENDLSFIKSAGCGGDGMNAELEKKINEFLVKHNSSSKIMKGYGMTEVSAAAVTCTSNCNEIGSVGIPLILNNVSIVDKDTNESLPYGELGEICISGPTMMRGYRENSKKTDEIIRTHDEGVKWIHTGDCGKFNSDGSLFVKGRYKRIILRRGQTIYPDSIEDIIMRSGYVDSVAVVGMNHPEFVDVPVACIKVKPEFNSNIQEVVNELQNQCKNILPEYSLPYGYFVLNKMPYTKADKIDFKNLENTLNKDGGKKLIYKKEK